MTTEPAANDLRAVWRSQTPEPIRVSVGELRQASQDLARMAHWRNVVAYAAATFVIVAYGCCLYTFHAMLLRLGSSLTMAGALLVAYQFHRRGSVKTVQLELTLPCVEFYRAQLVRQRNLLLKAWKWQLLPLVPGIALCLLGVLQFVIEFSGSTSHLGILAVVVGVPIALIVSSFVLVGKLNTLGARTLQQRIDSLNIPRES